MFIGERYKLKAPARAIETIDGRLVSIVIPAGVTIEVVSVPTDESDMMVDALLEGRMIALRAIDVNAHAAEITD
jgi:hypothetical protein